MKLHYTDQGAGRPIVFIHGWCLSSAWWLYAEVEFASTNRVICLDLPGFGKSERPSTNYKFVDFAKSVCELLEALSLTDVTLVGFAFGAIVATEAAKQSPARVSAVCAIGLPDAACMPYLKMPGAMRRDWPQFARRSAAALLVRAKGADTESWIADMFRRTNLDWAIKTCLLMSEVSMGDCVHGVQVPTLLVHSDVDPVSPPERMREAIAGKSHLKLVVLQGAGHAMPIDASADLHSAIRNFIETLEHATY